MRSPSTCLRFFGGLSLMVLGALSGLGCSRRPVAPPILEFALVVEGKPGALELVYVPRSGAVTHVSLEDPLRFVVARASTATDATNGELGVGIELEPLEDKRFHDWTARNIGRRMAMLLDRRVCMVATISGALSGQVMLTGGSAPLTADQVQEIIEGLNPPR